MTDINKTILEKLLVPLGSIPMNSVDFGDIEEREIASCTLEEARDTLFRELFSTSRTFQNALSLY